ncbi:MAG: glucosaminidase domain-containing protein, partial [Chloroflexales bacterium]|nr:glucosaminidase domain-containing protein [Chloroflexales bacterium]
AAAAPAPGRVVTKERPAPRHGELRPAPLDELSEPPAARAGHASARLGDPMADLDRLERQAGARGQIGFGGYLPQAPPAMSMSHWAWMGVIFLASVLVLGTLWGGGEARDLSRWDSLLSGRLPGERRALFAGQARPAGDYVLRAPPSISARQIDRILALYSSPAAGTGEIWYNLGLRYGIDPAFAIAFFVHESAAGTAQAWAGLKADGGTTHNIGNIICAGYATCYGRFRDYPSWSDGIEDWYRLIDVEYLKGRGHKTVADIIPVYAPSVENDVQGYINVVQTMVDEWRTQGTP